MNKTIELTLSYNEGNATIWKPILEHAIRSLNL